MNSFSHALLVIDILGSFRRSDVRLLTIHNHIGTLGKGEIQRLDILRYIRSFGDAKLTNKK